MNERSSSAEVVPVEDDRLPRALRLRVREILEAGGIVAMPTETVYGLGVRADDESAVARVRELKGRPAGAGLTWHVAERGAVEHFTELLPLARRLAGRYWPGPLTLVLRGVPEGLAPIAEDGWTGVRLPAHRATQTLIETLGFPVAMTSANRHGEQPFTGAAEVAQAFGNEVELVLDGGPSRMGEASGVLALGPGRFELLREGLLPIGDLRSTAGLRIGFVCTGNTCRSPMAEGLARALLRERLGASGERGAPDIDAFGFAVSSMGVFAGSGSPASAHAVEVLAERGIDISDHRSSTATQERVLELERVYCLTRGHLESLRQNLPPGRARHIQLLDPTGEDVPDPIGGSRADYERCAEKIRKAIGLRAADWA